MSLSKDEVLANMRRDLRELPAIRQPGAERIIATIAATFAEVDRLRAELALSQFGNGKLLAEAIEWREMANELRARLSPNNGEAVGPSAGGDGSINLLRPVPGDLVERDWKKLHASVKKGAAFLQREGCSAANALYELAAAHGADTALAAGYAHTACGALQSIEHSVHQAGIIVATAFQNPAAPIAQPAGEASGDNLFRAASDLPSGMAPMQHAERDAAEQAYTLTSFDYVRDPVGSAPWAEYWRGWWHRSMLTLPATAAPQHPEPARLEAGEKPTMENTVRPLGSPDDLEWPAQQGAEAVALPEPSRYTKDGEGVWEFTETQLHAILAHPHTGEGARDGEYPSVGLFRTSDGVCRVTMKIDGKWVRIIEERGPVISHYVSHHGIAECVAAIAAERKGETK